MENPNKPKNAFLKFLPKATSAVYFQNPTYSPGRDHHHHNNHHSSTKLKAHAHKGFSGPLNFSSLPIEARQKPKNGGYDSQEPTSPKVSCMGQIKCKHKKKKFVQTSKIHVNEQSNVKSKEVKESGSKFSNLFSLRSSKSEKTSAGGMHGLQAVTRVNKVRKGGGTTQDGVNNKIKGMPSLGNMRKFASGRETLGNFDWSAHQIAPIDNDRDYFSDDERRRDSDDNEDDYEKNEVIIPFSAPILLGGGNNNKLNLEPRKEINLWKRRTMHPPPPLALNS